jgi:uncharacterized protein YecT (DUF1311 family)
MDVKAKQASLGYAALALVACMAASCGAVDGGRTSNASGTTSDGTVDSKAGRSREPALLATGKDSAGARMQATDPASDLQHADTGLAEDALSGYRTSFQSCSDAAAGVTAEIMSCIDAELDYQDARLNRLYRNLHAKLHAREWQKLQAEERAWLARKGMECRAGAGGGTADAIDIASCELDFTVRRANQLEAIDGSR